MPFSPKSLEEKPYNMCLNCGFIGKNCDGPNFLAMDMPRLSEWCRLRKDYLHNLDTKWTNAYIADQAGLSKVSVDRFLSGNVDDLKMSTVARILKVLVNGTWGQYPCAMASGEKEYIDNPDLIEKNKTVIAQCERLQAAIDKMVVEHREEIIAVKEEANRKINFLRDQIKFKEDQMSAKDKLISERYAFLKRKDKIIVLLASLLAVAMVIIISALVIDKIDPALGFLWRTH